MKFVFCLLPRLFTTKIYNITQQVQLSLDFFLPKNSSLEIEDALIYLEGTVLSPSVDNLGLTGSGKLSLQKAGQQTIEL
jgi:hypothetical protein